MSETKEGAKIETVDKEIYDAWMKAFKTLNALSSEFGPFAEEQRYADPQHAQHLLYANSNISMALRNLLDYSDSFREIEKKADG